MRPTQICDLNFQVSSYQQFLCFWWDLIYDYSAPVPISWGNVTLIIYPIEVLPLFVFNTQTSLIYQMWYYGCSTALCVDTLATDILNDTSILQNCLGLSNKMYV